MSMRPENTNKRVNEMDRLGDICLLPLRIYTCVAVNTLLTVLATSYVHSHYWELLVLILWIAVVLAWNLLPIVTLRVVALSTASFYPPIQQATVIRDLYKFSDWVYLLPNLYLSFWIILTWILLTYRNTRSLLATLLVLAFCCAFLPKWKGLMPASLRHRDHSYVKCQESTRM